MAVHRLMMVRHGQSEWNDRNLFCGWYDSPLTRIGETEARNAGQAIKQMNLVFNEAHTSMLQRANRTLDIILHEIDQSDIPTYKTWRLNERHYGALTGLDKRETAAKYGEQQVQIWRRSYATPPPPMEPTHQYYHTIIDDPRYIQQLPKKQFPLAESLKSTIERTLPYWNDTIVPKIKEGRQLLIVAHGNSLRGIVKLLDDVSDEQIAKLNLPTGIPFMYELDTNLKPVVSMRFLGDEKTVRAAMDAIASQAKIHRK